MKILTIIICLFFQAVFMGCALVKVTDLNSPEQTSFNKIDLSEKQVLLFINISVDDMDQMDTIKSNVFVANLNELLSQDLQLKYKMKIVKKSIHSLDFNYVLNLQIQENNKYFETGLEKFFRGISFGFASQDVQKNIKIKLQLYDVKKNLTTSGESSHLSVYKYTAPMLIIPLNLDQNPSSYDPQIKEYRERILSLLSQIFDAK